LKIYEDAYKTYRKSPLGVGENKVLLLMYACQLDEDKKNEIIKI